MKRVFKRWIARTFFPVDGPTYRALYGGTWYKVEDELFHKVTGRPAARWWWQLRPKSSLHKCKLLLIERYDKS